MIKGISLAILFSILTTIGQVLWKTGLIKSGGYYIKETSILDNIFRILFSWYVIFGFIVFILSTFIWFYLLSNYKLSFIVPVCSVAFIFSLIAGKVFFHEEIIFQNWFGVIFIIIGVYFISK